MNMRRRAAVITAVAGIALTGVATAAPAMAATNASVQAGSSTAARSFAIDGTVSGIDATKGTVTITGANGSSSTVSIAPNASVSVDGSSAKLAKLPIGAQVKLSGSVKDGVSLATSVSATSVRPFADAGSVLSADAEGNTVSVKRAITGATTVYPVAAKALITLDGRIVALAALPAKAHILVAGTVAGDIRSAKTLTAVSRWSMNLSGTIAAVDASAGTVTVTTGSPATAVKLKVDPKATVTVNGKQVALANLPIGATVGLTGTETTAGASISGINATVSAKSTR